MSSGIHLPRRNFVGIGLGGILAALTGIDLNASAERAGGAGKAKQVLVLFEQGGVSQMDTWDPKPEAPVEHRSPFGAPSFIPRQAGSS